MTSTAKWVRTVGDMTVSSVLDGQLVMNATAEYTEMDASRWEPWRHLLDDGTDVVNQLGGYLIQSDDFVALIDLGFGPAEVDYWDAGQFLDSLAELGVTPAEITDIFFTHLHYDHIGWASVEGTPVFPNATFHCHEKDWAYFRGPDYVERPEELDFPLEMRAHIKLAPVADRVKTFDGPAEILPGLFVQSAPGHSPGTTVITIRSQGESAVFIGDVAHHQAELIEPDWQGIGDLDVAKARASRHAVADELAVSGTPFLAAHFRDFEWGTVVPSASGDGLAWQPLATSKRVMNNG